MPNRFNRRLLTRGALPSVGVLLLLQACGSDALVSRSTELGAAQSKLDAPSAEPCSADLMNPKSPENEPRKIKPLDPTLTKTQLDVDDEKIVDALNGSLEASTVPLEVAPVPEDIAKKLDEAKQQVSGLGKIEKDEEYDLQKQKIYDPIDAELLDLDIDPAIIDEKGLGDVSLEDLLRPRDWPGTLPPHFVDLRVRPRACGQYVSDAAERNAQRVYRNIELSQVHVEKVCLEPGSKLVVDTSNLETTVDTVIHVWDPAVSRFVAMNDDAVRGELRSHVAYTNGSTSRCVSVIVMNKRPRLAGKVHVERTVETGGVVQRKKLEVQLRSFPQDLRYASRDVDFEVATTRYTDLPKTPATLPLVLLQGPLLVGFDYDSGVGPAGKVRRAQLGTWRPTQALVLGRSVEARDLTFPTVYVKPWLQDALRPVNPFLRDLVHDDPPTLDPAIFPPATRIPAPPVGFKPIAPGGRVDLILDDPALDTDDDADGIGAETEAQLCTCDPRNRPSNPAGWYEWCRERSAHAPTAPDETRWFADTDHDGLTDREEIFGVELDQHPEDYAEPEAVFRTVALPVMGADPLQKDMFIEMDFVARPGHPNPHTLRSAGTRYLNWDSGLPTGDLLFRGELFDTIDGLFIAGARADLRNPNGVDGLRVHVDVGADPILTDAGRSEHCNWVCGTDAACLERCSASVDRERFLHRHRVFGSWGGGGTRISEAYVDATTEEGMYGLGLYCDINTWNTDACPPGPGKKVPDLRYVAYDTNVFFNRHRMRYFRYGLTSPYGGGGGQGRGPLFGSGLGAHVIAHEAGHTLGLSHAGHASWGDWNCKPHYLSQMNYAYNYNPRIGFSSASTATSTVLNPSNVREFDFTVSGLTPDAVDLITTSPFRFRADTSRLDAAGNGLANIDWNLSGGFDPGSIRGPATWCPWPGEATKANLQPLMERPEAEFFRNGATPDMVRVGNRLYAFYVDRYGRLKYRYGTLGPKSRGSCQSQQLGESCLTWSPEATFPTPRDVQAVSIVNWNDQLVVAYTEETLTSSQCEQKIAYSSAINSDGSIASWSSSGFGRLVQCRDIELVMLPVETSIAASGKILSVFARAYNDELLWIKSADPLTPGTWTTDSARDGAGNVLSAPIPPAVTVWPAPDYTSLGSTSPWNSLATACGVFPAQRTQPDGSTVVEARFYCFDRGAARWVQKTDFPAFRLTEKPTVAFHILRRADGEPIDATNLPGQFWIGYVPEGDRTGRVAWIHVSSKIDRTTPPTRFADWRLVFHGRHGNFWDYVTPDTGVVLHEELGLGALKGLTNAANAYYFQPFADGSFQAELKTGNDFHVMEANLCRPLRGAEPYCQGVAHTPFRY